jgi:hypothetical protein
MGGPIIWLALEYQNLLDLEEEIQNINLLPTNNY